MGERLGGGLLGFSKGRPNFSRVQLRTLGSRQTLLGLEISGVQFEVAVHMATLISVLLVYRGRLMDLLYGTLRRDGDAGGTWGCSPWRLSPLGSLGFSSGTRSKALREPVRTSHRLSGDGGDPVEHTPDARAGGMGRNQGGVWPC